MLSCNNLEQQNPYNEQIDIKSDIPSMRSKSRYCRGVASKTPKEILSRKKIPDEIVRKLFFIEEEYQRKGYD